MRKEAEQIIDKLIKLNSIAFEELIKLKTEIKDLSDHIKRVNDTLDEIIEKHHRDIEERR